MRPDPAASWLSVTRALRGAAGVTAVLRSLTGHPAAIGWGCDLPLHPSGLKLGSVTRMVAAALLTLPLALQGPGYRPGCWVHMPGGVSAALESPGRQCPRAQVHWGAPPAGMPATPAWTLQHCPGREEGRD